MACLSFYSNTSHERIGLFAKMQTTITGSLDDAYLAESVSLFERIHSGLCSCREEIDG